ncbi:Glutathione S-transferase F13 [Acorus calamus]|uniref:glutathione transferase n=1 Tax=Acorus calamus TaxID=4465 RepID=A0AAV9CQT5_ACOCL|nr:Glutathione S-transferase F13 [Acorus calamus]
MAMKLYGAPMSSCTARALACLEEKEAKYEMVPINLHGGEHKQPTHLARNPFGLIPALEDGDVTLFESRAISKYVAKKYKHSGTDLLRLGNEKESALVEVWLEVEGQQYSPHISPLVHQYIVVGGIYKQTPDEKVIAEETEKLAKVLDVYEARLSKSKYLAGDFYSLADLHHLPYTYYVMTTPVKKIFDARPHVKAWWTDISSRPASKKVTAGMKH